MTAKYLATLSRTQLTGHARDLGIKHPNHYSLPDLRMAVLARWRKKAENDPSLFLASGVRCPVNTRQFKCRTCGEGYPVAGTCRGRGEDRHPPKKCERA
jgi:hypothetical protein